MMKLIEEYKKTIAQLKIKTQKRDADEEHKKIAMMEKDQEIYYLKNFLNNIKNDLENKEQNLNNARQKIHKMKQDNANLNKLVHSADLKMPEIKNFEPIDILKGKS